MYHAFPPWTQGTADGVGAMGWIRAMGRVWVDGLETHRWNGTKSAFADCAPG